MKYDIIHNNITQGEHGENLSNWAIKLKCLNAFKWLWRRSQNQRVLFKTFGRSREKSSRVQEVGEIQ